MKTLMRIFEDLWNWANTVLRFIIKIFEFPVFGFPLYKIILTALTFIISAQFKSYYDAPRFELGIISPKTLSSNDIEKNLSQIVDNKNKGEPFEVDFHTDKLAIPLSKSPVPYVDDIYFYLISTKKDMIKSIIDKKGSLSTVELGKKDQSIEIFPIVIQNKGRSYGKYYLTIQFRSLNTIDDPQIRIKNVICESAHLEYLYGNRVNTLSKKLMSQNVPEQVIKLYNIIRATRDWLILSGDESAKSFDTIFLELLDEDKNVNRPKELIVLFHIECAECYDKARDYVQHIRLVPNGYSPFGLELEQSEKNEDSSCLKKED